MNQPTKTCILLVNLGTPDAPTPGAVGRYLREFLGDGRVIDIPWLPRKILVNGIIAPIRSFRSAREYKKVWTDEGSPLLLYGESLQRELQARMNTDEARRAFGGDVTVELAMRYQHPSMDHVMARMEKTVTTASASFCSRLRHDWVHPRKAKISAGGTSFRKSRYLVLGFRGI